MDVRRLFVATLVLGVVVGHRPFYALNVAVEGPVFSGTNKESDREPAVYVTAGQWVAISLHPTVRGMTPELEAVYLCPHWKVECLSQESERSYVIGEEGGFDVPKEVAQDVQWNGTALRVKLDNISPESEFVRVEFHVKMVSHDGKRTHKTKSQSVLFHVQEAATPVDPGESFVAQLEGAQGVKSTSHRILPLVLSVVIVATLLRESNRRKLAGLVGRLAPISPAEARARREQEREKALRILGHTEEDNWVTDDMDDLY